MSFIEVKQINKTFKVPEKINGKFGTLKTFFNRKYKYKTEFIMKKVTIYTDGACSYNPGPGGYASILMFNGHEKVISGGENGVSLSFCEKGGIALSRENIRRLEEILTLGEFNRTSGAECHNVSVIESIEKMYENEIVRQFEDVRLNFKGVIFHNKCLLGMFILLLYNKKGKITRKIIRNYKK